MQVPKATATTTAMPLASLSKHVTSAQPPSQAQHVISHALSCGSLVDAKPATLNPVEENTDMPKVGNKHYAYTKAGMAKAKKAAKKSGKKLVKKRKR
jgi:hypothetical protein